MLFDDFANDEDAAREEAELFVFGGILVEIRLVVVEKDGPFIDGLIRHFDGDGADLIWIGAVTEPHRGEAMICAVWIELTADVWFRTVDGDLHNTALRSDDVVCGGVESLVFEGDFGTVVKGEEIVCSVKERTCDWIVMRIFPPWSCDVDGWMVERNRDDFFPTVRDHRLRKIGMRAFLSSGLDGGK